MKAIILVAGYATRLYPLTLNTPKALLKIADKAIIDYIVDEINTIPAVDEVYVVSNHKFYNQFEDWANERNNKIKIKVLNDGTTNEDNRRGAIGDILYTIQEECIDDDVIIIAGDTFFTYPLIDYYNSFVKNNKDCVCVKKIEDRELLKSFGVALLDEDGKILNIEEKPKEPKSDIAMYATYIYKRETLPLFKEYLDEKNNKDAPGYVTQWLYKIKELYAYKIDGECYDIGTPEAYKNINELFGNK